MDKNKQAAALIRHTQAPPDQISFVVVQSSAFAGRHAFKKRCSRIARHHLVVILPGGDALCVMPRHRWQWPNNTTVVLLGHCHLWRGIPDRAIGLPRRHWHWHWHWHRQCHWHRGADLWLRCLCGLIWPGCWGLGRCAGLQRRSAGLAWHKRGEPAEEAFPQ